MKNILVRTSIAAATALTITTGVLALTSTPASAAPTVSLAHYQNSQIDGFQLVHHKPRKQRFIPPHRIKRIVHRHGYHHIKRVVWRNGKYHVRAHGRRGPVKLVLHSRTGEILKRKWLKPPRRVHYHDGYYQGGYRYGGSYNGLSWTFSFGR